MFVAAQHSTPQLIVLMTATMTVATLCAEIAEINDDIAIGAPILHSISILRTVVFKCVNPYGVHPLPSTEGFASVGIQSLSMERIFVMRDSFSTIPRNRTMANKDRLKEVFSEERMVNHIRQEASTIHLLTLMVRRRVRRREGARSTQRPRTEENNRTQMVSAMPLKGLEKVGYGFTGRYNYLIDEAKRVPGKAAWMNKIWNVRQRLRCPTRTVIFILRGLTAVNSYIREFHMERV